MDRSMFDAVAYFTEMAQKNKKAVENGFVPVVVSSPSNLEGLFEEYRDNDRFVAISDANTENLSSPDGTYGFSKRRAYTVWILAAYEFGNMADRQEKLDLCRAIFHEFMSKVIHDKYQYEEKMMYFDTHSVPNQDLGSKLIDGLTGKFFTLYVSEPIDLVYDENEWLS